jgi:hypothetical protein
MPVATQNKPVLQDSYDPIEESDLAAFEVTIKARLPNDYRSFLLDHNGGGFPTQVATKFDYRDRSYAAVWVFYGLHTNDDSDLATSFQITSGGRPSSFLPIGYDGSGGQICLSTNAHGFGSVWKVLQISEAHITDQASWSRIGSNFAGFLDSLCYDSFAEADWKELNPPFRFAKSGDFTRLTEWLKTHDDFDARDEEGMSLLTSAAHSRQSHIVRLLLEQGADISSRDNTGQTPLHWAAYGFSLDSAKLLIRAGADVDAIDEDGNTPLLIGVARGHRVPRLLLENGANVKARNHAGESALDHCHNYRRYLEPLLLQHRANE